MKSVMDIGNLNSCLEKIKIYKNEEELKFSNIKDLFSITSYCYKTNNTIKLINKQNEIASKLYIISKIHTNNIYIINKNIEKYQKTSTEVAKKFDNIV